MVVFNTQNRLGLRILLTVQDSEEVEKLLFWNLIYFRLQVRGS
jgi:hypothetical protein